MRRVDEHDSLWWIAAAPSVWLLHFLACYLTAALWCEKMAGPEGSLGPARIAIAVYSVVALGIVGTLGWHSYRRHRSGVTPYHFDNREGRARFMGITCLLLSAMSAVAILYVSLPAFFVESCQ